MSFSDGWRKNRWFVLGVLFLMLNSYAVLRYTSSIPPNHKTQASFSAGVDGLVSGMDQLDWKFSDGMVANSKVGVWTTGTGPLIIKPAVAGRFCWVATNELVFQPSEPWRDCTEYSVGFSDEKIRGSKALFHTAALNLDSVTQVDFDDSRHCTLRLSFNSIPVFPALNDYLSVKDGNNDDIKWKLVSKVSAHDVYIKTSPIMTDKFSLSLKKGLPANAGSLSVTESSRWSVDFSPDVLLKRIVPISSGFEDAYINVNFNTPPDMRRLADFMKVSPALDIVVGSLDYSWQAGFKMRGKFEPGMRYTVTFKAGLPALNGSVLKKDIVRQVYIPDRPAVVTFSSDGQYLSTRGNMQIAVNSINISKIKIDAERIYPNNLVQFAMRESSRYEGYRNWWSGSADKLSHNIAEKEYSIASNPNKTTETVFDMKDFMGDYSSGAFLLSIKQKNKRDKQQLVVVTDIGVSVKVSAKDLLVWANKINSLEPVAGGLVKVYSEENQEIYNGKTDNNGLLHITGDMKDKVPFLITVEQGDDISYLMLDGTKIALGADISGDNYRGSGYEAYLFSDRGIYRPGETVHVKAVIRGDNIVAPDKVFPVSLKIIRPDGRNYRTLTATINKWGTVAYDITLPEYVMTGSYKLELSIPGSKQVLGKTHIAVEDFVPPQIKVKADSKQKRITTDFEYTVNARHLFGSPAVGLSVSSRIQLRAVEFQPEAWKGYIFSDQEKKFNGLNKKVGSKKLDKDGNAAFKYKIPAKLRPASAIEAVAGVTVTEMSGRAVSSYISRMVDIYSYYVGIKKTHCGEVVKIGDVQTVALAVVNPDGSVAEQISSLKITLSRIEWSNVLKKNSDNTYSYKSDRRLVTVFKESIKLNNGIASYSFKPENSGQYILTVVAAEGRGGSASIQFYAGSPDSQWLSWSLDKPGEVELILDKPVYKVGDSATMLVKSPFAGKALLTVETDHVIVSRVFNMTGNTTEVEIPISEKLLPNVYCTVNVIREAKPEKIWHTHRAVGAISLSVDMPEKRLNVKINAPEKMRPETEFAATVQVTDDTGNGVEAELTIAAVDEGICMLTAFKTPEPATYFMRKRRLAVEQYDLYSLLVPEISSKIRGAASTVGGDAAVALRGRLNPIDARRFKPVALWKQSVMTDTDGNAAFTFNVPEFSGELRLMVVAVNKKAAGSSSVPVKVKRKVVVLSSLPRFLAPEDNAVVPVNVFNGTDKMQNVIVTLNCEGPLAVKKQVYKSTIDKAGSKLFEFKLSALKSVGKGLVKISVVTGDEEYSEDFEIAVRPASAHVIRSDRGTVKSGESVIVKLPDDFLVSTVKNRFVCSGQNSVKLKGALDYLLEYPYGCLEQTTSSAFPLLYLADLMEVIQPGRITKDDVADFVQAAIYRILGMQRADGGFSYWPNYTKTYYWGTIYVVNFLIEAEKAGYKVPSPQLKAGLDYLKKKLASPVRVDTSSDKNAWNREMRNRSYICYVLALSGKPNHGWMARLQEQKITDTATKINLAAALAASGNRKDAAGILDMLGVSEVSATERETYGSLNSAIRNNAMLLLVWLNINPESAVVVQLVKQLEKMQLNGGWFTTQDNAMALLALGKYSNVMQGEYKPFKAVVSWQNNGKTISSEFTNDNIMSLNTNEFAAGTEIIIRNSGPGNLYYNWQSSGVPVAGTAKAEDRRVSIRRELLDIDGKKIGSNNFEQGTLLVVKITINTFGETLHNLAIENLLPAGLEVENAALKTSQLVPWIKKKHPLKAQHVDVRDDRVVIFIDSIHGTKSYYYVARAVTKGEFVYPPISGECMYDPDVRSVGEKGTIIVNNE